MSLCDPDSEKLVLGAMMLNYQATDDVRGMLVADDFAEPKHSKVFDAIVANRLADEPTEPVAVARRLQDAGDLLRAGGTTYLYELLRIAPVPMQATYYARSVADWSVKRRLHEQATRVQQLAETSDVDKVTAAAIELVDIAAHRPAVDSDGWSPVDLQPYLTGSVPRPTPTIGLTRTDGLRLIYPGKEHGVMGEMESGKGWMCAASVAAELIAGNRVVYVHYEEADPLDLIVRLQALQVPDHVVAERLRFVAPAGPVTRTALDRLLDPLPSLVIHDGVNEAMSLHGWAIREEDGAASYRRRLVKPCLRLGVPTLSADHVVKDVDRRGRSPLGTIHKGNGLSGSQISLENVEPFGRGLRGRSHVFVTKDRPGYLRRHGKPTNVPGKTYMGELVVDDLQLNVPWPELTFYAPSGASADVPATVNPDAEVDDRVLQVVAELIAAGEEPTGRQIRAASPYGTNKTADAITRHVIDGRLLKQPGLRPNSYVYVPASD